LNSTLADDTRVGSGFVVSPDGNYVVYTLENTATNQHELFVVLAGGGTPRRLSDDLGDGLGVSRFSITITHDSRNVIYTASYTDTGIAELYIVPITGGDRLRLNNPLKTESIRSYTLSPDGQHVAYIANDAELTAYRSMELFIVPIDRSAAPIRLNTPLTPLRRVGRALFTPDGNTVVYSVDQITQTVLELYSTRADGSGTPIRLTNGNGSSGRSLSRLTMTEDGQFVTYVVSRQAGFDFDRVFYSVRTDGSTPPVRLSPAPTFESNSPSNNSRVGETFISPDNLWAFFTADLEIREQRNLYRVPINGSSVAIKVNPVLQNEFDDVQGPVMSPDGQWFVFSSPVPIPGTPSRQQLSLFRVPVPASSERVVLVDNLNIPISNGRPVFTPDSNDIVFSGALDAPSTKELYRIGIDGGQPLKLHADFTNRRQGISPIRPVKISPNGQRVLYSADRDTPGQEELFVTSIDGGSETKLNSVFAIADGDVSINYMIVPQGDRVIYVADQNTRFVFDLYSATFDPGDEGVDPGLVDQSLCVPISTSNGNVAVICL